MLPVHDLEVRVGARVLMSGVSFRVGPGDRAGLVGRNGAGKATLPRSLAGEAQHAGGTVTNNATVGYLPQDPRTGDLQVSARDRPPTARENASAPRLRRGAGAGTGA